MRLDTSVAAVVAVMTGAALVGCGGSVSAGNGAAPDAGTGGPDAGQAQMPGPDASIGPGPGQDASASPDATPADAGDHGSPSTTYPAFQPDVPQVMNNGGPTLAHPVVVTITWSTDPDVAKYEAFGDSIGGSNYWSTLNSEYSVSAVTSGTTNHVHITTAPPASMSDQDLQTFVTTNASSATSGWPAPTDQTIYAVYMSPGMSLMLGGQDACQQGVGGYHDESKTITTPFAYAIVPHCSGATSDDSVMSASHEFDEAATDPFPGTRPGYVGFDADHLSYEYWNQFQDEVGDACEFYKSSFFATTEATFAYQVQRQWSNKSAAAGHNPCVPVMAEPFYNMTLFPVQEDAITADLSALMAGKVQSKGFKAIVKQPRTFQLGFFSDAATSGPWTVTPTVDAQTPLTDNSGNPIANGTATVTLDKTSGLNGEKTNVTITPTAFNAQGVVFVLFTSEIQGGTSKHYLPILLSEK